MPLIIILLLMNISIAQAANCTVQNLRDVNFGNYNPLSSNNDHARGRIRLRCNGGGSVNYQVELTTGQAGSYNPRELWNGGHSSEIQYNLYTNNARTIIFGDGSGATVTVSGTLNLPNNPNRFRNRNINIYGRIPGLQTSARAGSYSDLINVIVNY